MTIDERPCATQYVLKLIDFPFPAYFIEVVSEQKITIGIKRDAMRFDSVASANGYREHRMALWRTSVEEDA
jgi:hypothetical protein